MSSLLENDIASLNEIFIDHQINFLKLSDQRTFIDSLVIEKNQQTFFPGDIVIYQNNRYRVDESDTKDMFLLRGSDGEFRFVEGDKLEKTGEHALVEEIQNAKIASTTDALFFQLKSSAAELFYNDSKKYASLKGSRIQLLPHQINAVYQIVNSLNHRFLIADEVGLGKTIEIGLLIKEFVIRYHYSSIFIIVPASLQYQWQQELQSKFDESFAILDSKSVKKVKKELETKSKSIVTEEMAVAAFLDQFPKAITSLDFAKREKITPVLTSRIYDMIIFDEAHRLRRDRTNVTRAFRFADEISLRTKSFFLLSATPFSGKIEELYFFVYLLDRNRVGSIHTFLSEYYNNGGAYLTQLMKDITIRRTKRDVGGFTKRNAMTVKYALSPLEKDFYDTMGNYVKTEYRKALEEGSKGGGCRSLMLCFFQKMMDSSRTAILSAIKKRITSLEIIIENSAKNISTLSGAYNKTLADWHDDFDDDIEESLKDQATTIKELTAELTALDILYRNGNSITCDTKLNELMQLVKQIKKTNKTEKIIIFTQFKTTMFLLHESLSYDYKPVVFHGSMNKDEKDAAIDLFRANHDIIICTEAGGEGRNLQFAKVMINYDLPWNPFKLEQRIGRIHRFGQIHDVLIYNFVMEESIGERIMEILTDKIKIFEEAFGDIEPLLGTIGSSGRGFDDLFMKLLLEGVDVANIIDKKLSISKEKMSQLTLSTEIPGSAENSPSKIKKEVEKIEKKLEQFFLNYSLFFPEDFKILKSEKIEKHNLYHLESRRESIKNNKAVFDFELYEQLASENNAVDYFHIEHPLIKKMIAVCTKIKTESNVLKRIEHPSIARFSFIVKYRYFRLSENYVTIDCDFDKEMNVIWKDAIDKLNTLIEIEKNQIYKQNKPVIDNELEKISDNYEKQIAALENVLEAYEFKNKQAEGDRYFLLIPKVKKQLQRLCRDRDDILQITREKLQISAEFNLHAIELC